jgi:Cu/Ag efflux pump CusA
VVIGGIITSTILTLLVLPALYLLVNRRKEEGPSRNAQDPAGVSAA